LSKVTLYLSNHNCFHRKQKWQSEKRNVSDQTWAGEGVIEQEARPTVKFRLYVFLLTRRLL